jgi:hypothetical protein
MYIILISNLSIMSRCFENRTFHIYKNPDVNSCNESSEYIQKVKFGVIYNENCKIVSAATNGLSQSQIARSFGVKYPNYQIRNDIFDVSCNYVKHL